MYKNAAHKYITERRRLSSIHYVLKLIL